MLDRCVPHPRHFATDLPLELIISADHDDRDLETSGAGGQDQRFIERYAVHAVLHILERDCVGQEPRGVACTCMHTDGHDRVERLIVAIHVDVKGRVAVVDLGWRQKLILQDVRTAGVA